MRTPTSSKSTALRLGFRSGLEMAVSAELKAGGNAFTYEQDKMHYVVPPRAATYLPDFVLLANGIVIETKGRFTTADRQKHILIKEQHPDVDIRFVFTNPNARLSKLSKTTYAKWCDDHGFMCAKKSVPQVWLDEAPEHARIAAFKAACLRPQLKNKELRSWFMKAFAAFTSSA